MGLTHAFSRRSAIFTSASSPSPQAPACHLATLPLEIEAYIVKLVHWQEEAWKEAKDVSKEARERHVNSLHTLASTCKEWNGLAAKRIFKVRSCLRIPA